MSPPETIESFVATVDIPRGPAILIRSQWPTNGSVFHFALASNCSLISRRSPKASPAETNKTAPQVLDPKSSFAASSKADSSRAIISSTVHSKKKPRHNWSDQPCLIRSQWPTLLLVFQINGTPGSRTPLVTSVAIISKGLRDITGSLLRTIQPAKAGSASPQCLCPVCGYVTATRSRFFSTSHSQPDACNPDGTGYSLQNKTGHSDYSGGLFREIGATIKTRYLIVTGQATHHQLNCFKLL